MDILEMFFNLVMGLMIFLFGVVLVYTWPQIY